MLFWGQTLKSDPKKLWETLKKFDYPIENHIKLCLTPINTSFAKLLRHFISDKMKLEPSTNL